MSGDNSLLGNTVDAGGALVDVGLDLAKHMGMGSIAEESPIGAGASTLFHAGMGVYDAATGDDHGAVKEATESAAAALGVIPGVGALMAPADMIGGAIASGGKQETLSGMAGDALGTALAGDGPAQPVSTAGQVGAVLGGLMGAVGNPLPVNAVGDAISGRNAATGSPVQMDVASAIANPLPVNLMVDAAKSLF